MYKLCKTEQSAKRQRELECQLLGMMSTHRYEEITITDFCSQAGIPRKAFFRYFSSKDGALHALIDHTLLDFEAYSAVERIGVNDPRERELFRFFQFWKTQKPFLDALTNSDISGILVTRTIDYALSDSTAYRRFVSSDGPNVREYSITFSICGIMSLVLKWYQTGYQLSADRMARLAVELLTKPLLQTES